MKTFIAMGLLSLGLLFASHAQEVQRQGWDPNEIIQGQDSKIPQEQLYFFIVDSNYSNRNTVATSPEPIRKQLSYKQLFDAYREKYRTGSFPDWADNRASTQTLSGSLASPELTPAISTVGNIQIQCMNAEAVGKPQLNLCNEHTMPQVTPDCFIEPKQSYALIQLSDYLRKNKDRYVLAYFDTEELCRETQALVTSATARGDIKIIFALRASQLDDENANVYSINFFKPTGLYPHLELERLIKEETEKFNHAKIN